MDKTIRCKDCSTEFVYSVRDQEFYKTNNFDDPKRCKDCRAKKKANQSFGSY